MTQRWEKICSLPEHDIQDIQHFYAEIFPIQIRDRFSKWLEEKPWSQLDDNNADHRVNYALPLLRELIDMVDGIAKLNVSFKEHSKTLKEKYIADPLKLVHDVKCCFAYEEEILSKFNSSTIHSVASDEMDIGQITEDSQALFRFIAIIASQNEDLKKKQQEFALIIEQLRLINAFFQKKEEESKERLSEIQSLLEEDIASDVHQQMDKIEESSKESNNQKDMIKQHFLKSVKGVQELQTAITQSFTESLAEHQRIEKSIVEFDLPDWKYKQQMACNGEPLPPSYLQHIKTRCCSLSNSIIHHLQHMIKLKKIVSLMPFQNMSINTCILSLHNDLSTMLFRFVSSTFIIDQQPPQVIRKDSKFEASVLCPVGRAVDTQSCLPKVNVYLINETSAKAATLSSSESVTCKDLLNNEAIVDIHPDGSFSAKFKNLMLKDFKREGKKSNMRIADEKYWLMFECRVQIGGIDLPQPLKVLSCPMIIISNVSQECQALGTVVWDHQFTRRDRHLFEVPSSVPWPALAALLSTRFKHETGRGLTEAQIKYLATKLIGQCDDFENKHVTFEQFCKVNLGDHNFTFWDWFYQLLRLTKDHLHDLWKDGIIFEFISKADAKRKLMNPSINDGNIICRFSESQLGGVTIVVKECIGDKRKIYHNGPFTCKDLEISSLAQIIKNGQHYKYVYPNKPKHEVLAQFCNDIQERGSNSDGYRSFIWMVKMSYPEDEDPELSDCGELMKELIDEFDIGQYGFSFADPNEMVVDD